MFKLIQSSPYGVDIFYLDRLVVTYSPSELKQLRTAIDDYLSDGIQNDVLRVCAKNGLNPTKLNLVKSLRKIKKLDLKDAVKQIELMFVFDRNGRGSKR